MTTVIGSAGAGDFGGVARRDLTFGPTQSTISVTIKIIDDGIVESPESFNVSLETSHPRVQFSRRTATVIINDDDSKFSVSAMYYCSASVG